MCFSQKQYTCIVCLKPSKKKHMAVVFFLVFFVTFNFRNVKHVLFCWCSYTLLLLSVPFHTSSFSSTRSYVTARSSQRTRVWLKTVILKRVIVTMSVQTVVRQAGPVSVQTFSLIDFLYLFTLFCLRLFFFVSLCVLSCR